MLFGTLFSGLLNPKLAAGTMAVWLLGRIVYTLGYNTCIYSAFHVACQWEG